MGLSACGGLAGDAVLSVDGKALTKDTFNHWMLLSVGSLEGAGVGSAKPVAPEPPDFTACIKHRQKLTPKPAKGQEAPSEATLKKSCKEEYEALKKQVLPKLIQYEWIIGESAALGIKVSDAEVKKQFKTEVAAAKVGELQRYLKSTGNTVSDLLLRVKIGILAKKIVEKIKTVKHTPTTAEIAAYYHGKENRAAFVKPETRTIEIILTKSEAATKKAEQEVESGKSFASVAKRVSIDPSKNAGGLIAEVTVNGGQLPAELSSAVFAAQPGVLGGPVKSTLSNGYYAYRVKSVNPGSTESLTAAAPLIKKQLEAPSERLKGFLKGFKAKWKAKTDCRAEYVVPQCKQGKEETPAVP